MSPRPVIRHRADRFPAHAERSADPGSLVVEEVVAGYDGAPPVLHKVSVTVRPGEITLVVGRNGAGKTTLLRAMSGLLKPRSGRIALEATDLSRKRPSSIARLGIAHVPEDRRVLPAMTVMDNLRVGGWVFRRQKDLAAALDEVADLFPALSAWHSRRAGTLSGGQQQLLSIARAMMLRPTVLLLDEPLTGLDPFFQEQVMQVVGVIRDRGCAVLLVEQNLSRSMPAADHVIVLDEGRVGVRGSAAELTRDEVIKSLFVNAALTSAERNGR